MADWPIHCSYFVLFYFLINFVYFHCARTFCCSCRRYCDVQGFPGFSLLLLHLHVHLGIARHVNYIRPRFSEQRPRKNSLIFFFPFFFSLLFHHSIVYPCRSPCETSTPESCLPVTSTSWQSLAAVGPVQERLV